MKSIVYFSVFASLVILLTGCNKDEGDSGPPAPVAGFTVSGGSITPATVTFTNTSSNADEYRWDFGNDSTSTQSNPTFLYNVYGSYVVTLVAFQASTSRIDSVQQTVTINPRYVTLSHVILEAMPFTRPNGDNWDSGQGFESAPDLLAVLSRPRNNLWTSFTYDDTHEDHLPLLMQNSGVDFQTDSLSLEYNINLRDEDTDTFEGIAFVSFNFSDLAFSFGYQDNYLISTGPDVRVRLFVIWE